jgi:hypothetical protein
VGITGGTLNLHAQHAVTAIFNTSQVASLDVVVETGPAGTGVVLGFRGKQFCFAPDASVNA